MAFMTFHIYIIYIYTYWEESSQLTFIFFRAVENHQPVVGVCESVAINGDTSQQTEIINVLRYLRLAMIWGSRKGVPRKSSKLLVMWNGVCPIFWLPQFRETPM